MFFSSFDDMVETVGQIVEFAGGNVPTGWALADGQLLPISEYRDLFDIIGTTYGGDGVTDFALPDLDGRTVIGASLPVVSPLARAALAAVSDDDNVGDVMGANDIFLTPAELPPAVPEPSTWALLMAGFATMGFLLRRKQTSLSTAASNKSGG